MVMGRSSSWGLWRSGLWVFNGYPHITRGYPQSLVLKTYFLVLKDYLLTVTNPTDTHKMSKTLSVIRKWIMSEHLQ